MNNHHVDDIRTALETSPQVREAVAAMLAALGEARECGVYSFTDTCDYEHTVETRFAKYQHAVDFERRIAAASKAVDKWIMESRDDDMDANGQTVTVWSAEIQVANKSHFRVRSTKEAAMESVTESYRPIDTPHYEWEALSRNMYVTTIDDTPPYKITATVRAHEVTLPATPQSPATPPPADSEDRQLATIARGIAERIELYNLPISGDTHFSFIHGSTRYVGDLHAPHPAPLMEALRQLALWKAGKQAAEAGEAAPVDALATARERIAELEAEVARLQAERDSAARDANKPLLKLLERMEYILWEIDHIESNSPLKREARFVLKLIREEKERLAASTSVPENEATDGA